MKFGQTWHLEALAKVSSLAAALAWDAHRHAARETAAVAVEGRGARFSASEWAGLGSGVGQCSSGPKTRPQKDFWTLKPPPRKISETQAASRNLVTMTETRDLNCGRMVSWEK